MFLEKTITSPSGIKTLSPKKKKDFRLLNKKHLIKSVIYRFYSSSITFLISVVLTGNLVLSASIGMLDLLIKIFTYYFFDEIWYRVTGFKTKPSVIWLTGLSGSGKSTIATHLMKKFNNRAVLPVMLDGDEIRQAIRQNGFDEDSRKKHNLNVGFISSLFEKQGNVVIVSLISPYDDIRDEVRAMCGNFVEVYVSTDLQTCMQRDPKGLYKKALNGEIAEFTGITAPYFPPANPEIVLDTAVLSVSECTDKIFKYYRHEI